MAPDKNDISLDEDELRKLLEGDGDGATGLEEAEEAGGEAPAQAADEPFAGLALDPAELENMVPEAVEEPEDGRGLAGPEIAVPQAAAAPKGDGNRRGDSTRARAAPSRQSGIGAVPTATVQPAQFASFDSASGRPDARSPITDLGILLDVPLRVTVELGRTEMSVREILNLGVGSVVELDRSAGEVLDVLVNGTPIAQGEVVVVDEQFGIRITQVCGPQGKDLLEMGGLR